MSNICIIKEINLILQQNTRIYAENICSKLEVFSSQASELQQCFSLLRQYFILVKSTVSTQAHKNGICLQSKFIDNVLQILSNRQKSSSPPRCSLCYILMTEFLTNQPDDREAEERVNLARAQIFQGKKSKCINKACCDVLRSIQNSEFPTTTEEVFYKLCVISLLHGVSTQAGQLNSPVDKLCQWFEHLFNTRDSNTSTASFSLPFLGIDSVFSDDQIMNLFSLSTFYKWFLQSDSQTPVKLDTTSLQTGDNENKELKDLEMPADMLKSVFVKSNILDRLLPKTVDYCLRLIEHTERKSKGQNDEIQANCLVEAVNVLDLACCIDGNQTAKVFQEVKRLNARLTQDSHNSLVRVPVLQFFFHHSSSVVHDPRDTYQQFFLHFLSDQYSDKYLMQSLVNFLTQNLFDLAMNTDILIQYFPNIFKILAWHPTTFFGRFSEMLPTLMNWETSLEIFHLLLDLPCLTCTLELTEKCRRSEPLNIAPDQEVNSSIEAFYSPRYRPLFSYIARGESGRGDTIDRLSRLHSVLSDLSGNPRVLACCQIVPSLLRAWFETLLDSEDPNFLSQLIPVILERSGLLYGVPSFIFDAQKVMSENILKLCKAYPEIVTQQRSEILEFLQTTANMAGRDDIYCNLIYCMGEYSAQRNSTECTTEVIGKIYEVLEVVTYELLGHLGGQEQDFSIAKVISMLMSAISKLASRSQDLIPRAILCLTKIAKQQNLVILSSAAKDVLSNRVTALIAVLQNPDSSSHVLNEQKNLDRCHMDNTSTHSVMRGMDRILTLHD